MTTFQNKQYAKTMRRALATAAALCISAGAVSYQMRKSIVWPNEATDTKTNRVTLHTGWRLTPAGVSVALPGDQPLKMLISPDSRTLFVNTAGFHNHTVNLIDINRAKLVQSVDVQNTWAGMCMDPEGDDLYVAGGSVPGADFRASAMKHGATAADLTILDSPIHRLPFRSGRLGKPAGIAIPGLDEKSRFTAGLAASREEALFVINMNTDTVYRLAGKPRAVTAKAKVGYRPFGLALSPDEKRLAVSNWGDRSVSLLDAETLHVITKVTVGGHPNDIVWAKDGRLFVANANSDTVSVVRNGKVIETIAVGLGRQFAIGAAPVGLAVTPNGNRLYVANSGSNCIAVVDTPAAGGSVVRGFIPSGWYPTSVAVTPDGKRIVIGTGKGLGGNRNVPPTTPYPETSDDGRTRYDYTGNLLKGFVSIVETPDAAKLAAYSRQVRENLPVRPDTVVARQQIDRVQTRVFPKIKHVVYIIRENRTYDQVFGDIPGGNGDANITMYGEKITPNAHALARQTVLLDNLYCSGEVSVDGHQWCSAANATDFTEKAWINGYSDRGDLDGDERLSASPGGYLWENCARHGKSYRSYGEFTGFKANPKSAPVYTGIPTLAGHASVAYWEAKNRGSRDTDLAEVFINDLKAAESKGDWPNFMVMSLGEDHTHGLEPGSFTPYACVGSNDQALGRIVEAVSKSRFWAETAIFVIEDDAQDGPDHVDTHRTVGLVLSPYVRQGMVDSTLYSTVSMIRTMELILGLPPMTQNDALAMPMYNCFTDAASMTAYTRREAQTDLQARNPKPTDGKPVTKLDFSDYDRADPAILNAQLWSFSKPGVPMPAPVRSGALLR